MIRRVLLLAAMLGAAAHPAPADLLIVNGDFELPFEPEWVAAHSTTGYSIDRAIDYHPDPDYEARVRQTAGGYVRLSQTVPVVDTEIEFSVGLRLHAQATAEAWAAASVELAYLDETQDVLGATRLASWTHYCPWENGPALHLIGLPADMWLDWSFNINEELPELPAVDPAAVRYLRVSIYTYAYEC